MPRPILAEAQIHPAIREQITRHEHAIVEEVQAAVAQQLYTSMGEQRRTLLVVPGQEENAGGAGTDDTAGVPKKICKEPSWDFR